MSPCPAFDYAKQACGLFLNQRQFDRQGERKVGDRGWSICNVRIGVGAS